MDFLTKEESYAERRQLFKNIWDTAMQIDDKDAEIMNKPKVIKTLRLDEVDKCVVGKKKKHRIKILRNVCNKILDFCDRQDADDNFYEQMAAEGQSPPQPKTEQLPKKPKVTKLKKKQVIKAKSLFSPLNEQPQPKSTTLERKDGLMSKGTAKTSRNNSPSKFKRTTIVQNSLITNQKLSSIKPSPTNKLDTNNMPGDKGETGHRKKHIKKKHIKKKLTNLPAPQGYVTKYKSTHAQRAAIDLRKELLRYHKLMIY